MIQQFYSYVYTQKNWKNGLKQIICTLMFIAALFTIAKRQKQTKGTPTDEWISKRWCMHTKGRFSPKRGKSTVTCYSMDGACGKINGLQKRNSVWFPLHKVLRVVSFISAEGRMVVSRSRGEGKWGIIVWWLENFSLGWWKGSGDGR